MRVRTNVKWAAVARNSNLCDSNSIGQRRCHFMLWFLRSFPLCATFYHCFTALFRSCLGLRLWRALSCPISGQWGDCKEICKDKWGGRAVWRKILLILHQHLVLVYKDFLFQVSSLRRMLGSHLKLCGSVKPLLCFKARSLLWWRPLAILDFVG